MMIKLGKMTDYAIVVMVHLAKEGASSSAHQLAEKTGVPEPTVAKVLKILAKGHLVESTRGAAGGYKLSKAAGQISVAEIITVMDGPIAIVSCVDEQGEDCVAQALCPVKGSWNRVNDAIKGALEKVLLSEMTVSFCGKSHDFMKETNAGCT
jgi:FeS assembly SUF system regulator